MGRVYLQAKMTRTVSYGIALVKLCHSLGTATAQPRTAMAEPRHSYGTAIQPRHRHGTVTAQARHSYSTARAQPRHSHGTARAHPRHSYGTATAQPRHSQGTATAQPGHSYGTVLCTPLQFSFPAHLPAPHLSLVLSCVSGHPVAG